MRKSIFIASLFLISTGSFAQPQLHKGAVSVKSFTDDGSFKVTGQAYDSYGFDGNGTDISGYYFVEDKLAFGFSKRSYDNTYGANYFNTACDVDQTSLLISYHPERTNYFTGEGHGLNIGIRNTDSDVDCSTDIGDLWASVESNYLNIEATRGLGNGLVLELAFESDTENLLDDRGVSFGLNKMLDGNVYFSFGVFLHQSSENDAGDYTQNSRLSLGAGYRF